MTEMPDEQEAVKIWEEFFCHKTDQYYYKPIAMGIAISYPDVRSIYIKYAHINEFNGDLAIWVLDHPVSMIVAAEQAISNVLEPKHADKRIHFRVKDLPDDGGTAMVRVPVRGIRPKHRGKLIAVEGTFNLNTEVRARPLNVPFKCNLCGMETSMPQYESTRLVYPSKCLSCKKSTGKGQFVPQLDNNVMAGNMQYGGGDIEKADLIAFQKLMLTERTETLQGNEKPQCMTVLLEDDLAGIYNPGDRLVLNCIPMKVLKEKSNNQKMAEFETVLYGISVDTTGLSQAIIITPTDEQQIRALSERPDLMDAIVGSIAPSIKGMETIKLALALQVMGSYSRNKPDGTWFRGDSGILLVGDPGCCKSVLLRFMATLAPRGLYGNATSASKSGWVAGLRMSKAFGEERWVLEAGLVVLANGGLSCLDEIEKMPNEQRQMLLEAMEQQTVTFDKIVKGVLQARTAVLAAANPKLGRFNAFSRIWEQISMSPPFLSRFDCIFPIADVPNKKLDTEIATHMGKAVQMSAIDAVREKNMQSSVSVPDTNVSRPIINLDLLKKYIVHGRQSVFPVMTDEALQVLDEFYVQMRSKYSQEGSVAMAPRQLDGLFRLTESAARLRLSDKAGPEDAGLACKVTEAWLKAIANDSGHIDIDSVETSYPRSQRDRIIAITNLVQDLSEGGRSATTADIVSHANRMGFPEDVVRETLKRLKADGNLFEPRHDEWKIIR